MTPKKAILKPPEGESTWSAKARLSVTVAYLLREFEGKSIYLADPIVEQELENLRELAKKVHAQLVRYVAEQEKITPVQAAQISCFGVFDNIQKKFSKKLEAYVSRDLLLDLGRCEGNWGGRLLLQLASAYVRSDSTINYYCKRYIFLHGSYIEID